jgi:excinuclease UvrABC ATPase subunit
VIVVEHDEDAIRAADHVIDIGPAQAFTAVR